MEKSWKIIGHGKVMEFSRSWKKSWKTQIWTNLFCRFCRTLCFERVFKFCNKYFLITFQLFDVCSLRKSSSYNGESMSRTRVVVIATFFVYFTFQTCEIVMEKGIESHGKVMEKSWNFTEA